MGGEQRRVPYNITGLSVNRYIHDPSDWTKSQWIAPLGASGHPGSPHYADQVWLQVQPRSSRPAQPVCCTDTTLHVLHSRSSPPKAELWSRVETIPQLWEWPDVENAAETQQLLQPMAASKI